MRFVHSRQRGVALLIVLWACTLLAILVGGYASLVHVETEQARYTLALQKSRYAAEAGVMRAIHDTYVRRSSNQGPENGEHWIGDGRPFVFRLGDAKVVVTVEDEAGKVDLNSADTTVLASLFAAAGADPRRAADIAVEVRVWRTDVAVPDAEAIERYQAAGRSYAPREARFPSVEELQSVLGMDSQLFARVEPALTLWSGRLVPAPYYASPLVLTALPGMTSESVRTYVEQRRAFTAGYRAPLPNNLQGGWVRGSPVVTIESTGKAAEDISATLRVTVRFDQLTGTPSPDRPLYTILRWREMPRG